MRMTSITLAAAMTLSLAGAAFAQGAPGGNGSGGNVTGGSTTNSSASEPGNVPPGGAGVGTGSSSNPAGVIDGTNANPNPGRAGGVNSPSSPANGAGTAGGR